ncbi:tetratricopeptide repeat protein [Pseudohalioglobus lutimaris]|uniref:Tetratricopeptide repeat protein n=1 Tax=Pseudohalioglobus lutimaris TaxID=1737061 RepID=A0A2N5X3U2_9GAMM|nr:tetratricopeptide repeat protein [Pseudohalioglobus lutimaris]PLW69143.1 tetratricopeptide repeat protein [Pseudohalioglobus lutimaris]
MILLKNHIWTRAALLALPLVVAQVAVTQLQRDAGFAPLSSAVAQEKQADTRETRRTPALRNKVYEKLAEAQAEAEAKNLPGAEKILDGMVAAGGKKALNSYELANVYNLYAFIYYSQENYSKALKAYENVVSQPDIPLAMEINTRYTIAQLYFVQEDWKRGIDALLKWFDMTETPNANAYVLLSQGYYQMKDYDKALLNVEKAISMFNEKGKLPKEQWYNLARFLYFEKGDIDKTVEILEILLTHYPKKQYWVQVSHMYGEQKKEPEQLAAMETAYVQGMLDKGTEQVTMAYLFLNGDVPYKAAKVMDKGLKDGTIEDKSKNWEVAGSAWRQAQEVDKSIPAMEKAAAKSDTGELYARLGNIYLDGDENEKAISAINKGLSRGGVKRPDNARLVLGMAYFNTKQYDKAREAFKSAARDERSSKYAAQWIKYMDTELERQRSLAEG